MALNDLNFMAHPSSPLDFLSSSQNKSFVVPWKCQALFLLSLWVWCVCGLKYCLFLLPSTLPLLPGQFLTSCLTPWQTQLSKHFLQEAFSDSQKPKQGLSMYSQSILALILWYKSSWFFFSILSPTGDYKLIEGAEYILLIIIFLRYWTWQIVRAKKRLLN